MEPQHSTDASSTINVWDLPGWHAMPYRLVCVQLPDQSTFFLHAQDLMVHQAEVQAQGDEAYVGFLLANEVLPSVVERPESLITIAKSLSFDDAISMSVQPFWRTALVFLRRWWRDDAKFVLISLSKDND